MVAQAFFRQKTTGLSAIAVLAMALLLVPLAKAFSLHSSFFDLGIFESLLFRVTHFDEWPLAFAGHAQWFSLLYGWLYGLFPSAVTPYLLVGGQALLLLVPVIWFYRRYGLFAAFVYLAYVPLWANAHFDFHFDHLAVPLLMAFYLALLDRRIGWAVLSATLVMFVKEPFALETAACGALMLWAAFHGESIWGPPKKQVNRRLMVIGALWLIGAGIGYFCFAMGYLLPYFAPDGWGGSLGGAAFGWLGHGLGEIIRTIVTRPQAIVLDIVTTPGKLVYLGVVFGLLAFIPLLRPVFLIPALPLLGIAMLSHLPNYYDYNTHYTAGLIVPVMFAFVHGLPKARALWIRGGGWVWRKVFNPRPGPGPRPGPRPGPLPGGEGISLLGENTLGVVREARLSKAFYVLLALWILGGHVMMSPSPISRLFWSDKVWSYSWRAYVPTARDAMMKAAMEKYIPADPDVSVTTQNAVNWGYLARRKVYLPFPLGIAEPYKEMDWSNRTMKGFREFVETGYKSASITHDRYADYVVLDLKRPWFLVDKGCEWIYGACRDKKMAKEFLGWVAYARSVYDPVFERDGFMILKRRGT